MLSCEVMAVRKRIVRIWDVPAGGLLTGLAVTGAAFLAGGLAGIFLAAGVDGGGNASLSAYIQSYMAAAQSGSVELPGLGLVLWETLRWPLLAALLGCTALGVVALPVLFAVRGFFFAFAVTAFVRMFGGVGGVAAFFAFGLTGMIAVPSLFVLGVQGFVSSAELAGRMLGDTRRSLPFSRTYLVRLGLCGLALGLCVLLELFAVPALLRSAAGLF